MILLTGGAGFVGLNVAEQLLARGEEVALFDLSPPPRGIKADFEQGDVTDRDVILALIRVQAQRLIKLPLIGKTRGAVG